MNISELSNEINGFKSLNEGEYSEYILNSIENKFSKDEFNIQEEAKEIKF